jgi:peptidoglycan hydrolase CwlO-like protein
MMFASTRAAVAALTAALLVLFAASPSGAVGTESQPTVAELRAQADAIATQYFAALARYETLDRTITDNKGKVARLRVRARKAQSEARARAVSFYRTSNTRLTSVIASEDAFVAARRLRLIGQVTDRDRAVYARLRAATRRLDASRHRLETERKEQSDALADLQNQSSAMESKLALAQQLEQAAAQAAQAAQAAPPSAPAATVAPATPDVAPVAPATTAAPPTTTTTAKPPSTPVSPPYSGTPGTNPHHDDPFLTCVRARESGGNYSVVNPAGPYLGAYQFLQSTWNATANHMGRPSLVGVPPNIATPYDQDDVAWALYQWQGAAPWGGGCP